MSTEYIKYKGKGEHSVSTLEKIIEQREEELHILKSSELIKQRDELIKALKESQNMLMGVDWSEDEGYPECQYVFERNQKLLESIEFKH